MRAARWALKRCIRAAFELRAEDAGVFTRDLYWCASIAGQRLPRLQQQLQEALELYVALLEPDQQQQQQQPQQQPLSQASIGVHASVQAACRVAGNLCTALDDAFCERMLAEEPGWLTKHIAASPLVSHLPIIACASTLLVAWLVCTDVLMWPYVSHLGPRLNTDLFTPALLLCATGRAQVQQYLVAALAATGHSHSS